MLLSSLAKAQTCVIAIKTKDAIYVGADSKVLTPVYNNLTHRWDSVFSMTCKIGHHGNFNFAVVGNLGEINKAAASKSILTATNSKQLIGNYIEEFKKNALLKMDSISKFNYSIFNSIYSINQPFAYCIFFGLENDTLFLKTMAFIRTENIGGNLSIAPAYLEYDTLALGHATEIYDMKMFDKPSTWSKGNISAIKSLIKLSEKYNPLNVGGEINILEVTRKRTLWKQP